MPRLRTGFQGFRRCETVLQYRFDWRHLLCSVDRLVWSSVAHVATEGQEDKGPSASSGRQTARSLTCAAMLG